MYVTPPVSHVEMWPYVAVAAVGLETHALTAILIFQLTMTLPLPVTSQLTPPTMPHDVDSHAVPVNTPSPVASLCTHQPRSWSKAEAPSNM